MRQRRSRDCEWMRQRRSRDCEWMRQRRSVSASGFNDCLNGKFLHAVECFSMRVRLRLNEEAWYRKVVNCITYGMEAYRGLNDGAVVPNVWYGVGVRVAEGRMFNVLKRKCLRSMTGVKRLNRIRNENVQIRRGVMGELSCLPD